jgi:N-acyl-D-amino-acid deacylase
MHIRYAIGRLEALKEAIQIGRRACVPVHISHLMGRTPQESATLLEYIDRVAVHEVDFSFDSIPYCSASTLLLSQLPIQAWQDGPSGALRCMRDAELRAKLAASLAALNLENYRIAWIPGGRHDHLFGQSIARYIAERSEPAELAVLNLLEEADLAVLMVYRYGVSDEPAWPFLAHRCCMLGSDGIWFPQGVIHPRACGSAARMIGDLVRKQRLFTLEQAVHSMTGRPAKRFGLRDRGVLAEGNFADIIVFDPERVQDRATYYQPRLESEGVEHVWVNGCRVVRDGRPCRPDAPPGRALRYRQS